jgi:hypothetical protein
VSAEDADSDVNYQYQLGNSDNR